MIALTILRYAITLPVDLGAWLLVVIIRALWGESLRWEHGCLIVRLAPTSWPMRSWYRPWGGTTFGHAMMIAPRADAVIPHELVHVEQVEAHALAGLVVGIVFAALGWWPVGLAIWWALPLLAYASGGVVAVLRGQSFYADNLFERSARAIGGR